MQKMEEITLKMKEKQRQIKRNRKVVSRIGENRFYSSIDFDFPYFIVINILIKISKLPYELHCHEY